MMKNPIILLFFLVFTGCASLIYQAEDYEALYGPSTPKQRRLTEEDAALSQQQNKVSFYQDVKPILDSRCVVCHGCYDAPCQLKLGSVEGIDRGATKQIVYDISRLKAAAPTRLFIDAWDTAGWRRKDFYPVLNERRDSEDANLDNSVLAKLIQLKRQNPLPDTGKLDKDFAFDISRDLQCPTVEEFPKYQHQHPQWGMPYALARPVSERRRYPAAMAARGRKSRAATDFIEPISSDDCKMGKLFQRPYPETSSRFPLSL